MFNKFSSIITQKHWQCWGCQNKNLVNNYIFQREQKIQNQNFVFFLCPKCKGQFYWWHEQISKEYFFTKKVHVVLYEPEIVGNVGTIIRLAAAFDFQLHLIEPFGFIFSENWLKRSSTNHLHLTDVKLYSDWNEFIEQNKNISLILTSSRGQKLINDFNFLDFIKPIYLVFGSESRGLPTKLKKQHSAATVFIKQTKLVSSINLANAVSIFVFFVYHQYQGLNL